MKGDGAKAEREDAIQRLSTHHRQEQRIWHRRPLEDNPGVPSALSTYPMISLCKSSTKKQIQDLKFACKSQSFSLTQQKERK